MNDFLWKVVRENSIASKENVDVLSSFQINRNTKWYGMRCDQEKSLMNGDLTLCTDITLTEVPTPVDNTDSDLPYQIYEPSVLSWVDVISQLMTVRFSGCNPYFTAKAGSIFPWMMTATIPYVFPTPDRLGRANFLTASFSIEQNESIGILKKGGKKN